MAKRQQRHTQHHENDQSGCMWSLFTKLDFCQGCSILKLLSDRSRNKHSVGGRCSRSRPTPLTRIDETCWSIDDGDKRKMQKVDDDRRSLKKLMEEEMSNGQHQKQQISNAAAEEIQSDAKYGSHLEKKQNMHTFIERKIKFLNRSPSNGHESLQALNRIVILKPKQIETSPSSSLQSRYNFMKERGSMRITSNFSPKEIIRKLKLVIQGSRNEWHWHLMQGVLHTTPYEQPCSDHSGGVTTGKDIPRETYFCMEEITKLSSNVKGHKIGKPQGCDEIIGQKDALASVKVQKIINMTNVDYPKHRKSKFYIEAERHLAEMVRTRNKDANLLRRQIPVNLWRMLSPPGYNLLPIISPGREREREKGHSFLSAQISFEPYDSLWKIGENMWQPKQEYIYSKPSPPMQNINIPLRINDKNPENRLQVSDSDTWKEFLRDAELQGSTCSYKAELSAEADVKVTEKTDIECPEENKFLNDPPKPNSSMVITPTNQGVDKTKIGEEERSSECLRLDSQEENQPSSSCLGPFLLRSLLIQKIEDEVGIGNKTEQPSPVEPFVLGNGISTGSTGFQPAVLQTSSLSWGEFFVSSRWRCSDQLLDTSLFDEAGQLIGDRNLLLDCINEVLLEAHDCSFGCSSWVSFLKPNTHLLPIKEGFIHEVREDIDWHLLPQGPLYTPDQIVRKDMGKANKWMDLKYNIQTIGNEMGDIILKELIEDIMYQLCA